MKLSETIWARCLAILALLALLTLASCNKEAGQNDDPADPDPVPTEGYTLAEDARIISDSFASSVMALDEEEKWFRTDGKERPAVGTILIYPKTSAIFPSGFLGRVTGIDGDKIYYEQVALEEAITQLQVDTMSLALADNISRIEDANGKEVQFTKTKSVSTGEVTITVPQTTWDIADFNVGDDVTAALKLQVTPDMELRLGMRFQAVIDDGELLSLMCLVDPTFKLGATFNAFGEVAAEQSFLIYQLYFTPIVAGPIVFTPKIALYGYMKVDGQVGLEASVSYQKSFTVGFGYQLGEWMGVERGFSAANESSNPATFGTKMEGAVNAGLKFTYEFRLYDIVGSETGVDLSIREAATAKVDFAKMEEGSPMLNDVCLSTSLVGKFYEDVNA